MASVTGFDPAQSGQQPTYTDIEGTHVVPFGVWGDTINPGVGVLGTCGAPTEESFVCPNTAVEGVAYGQDVCGVLGRSSHGPGVWGIGETTVGVMGMAGTKDDPTVIGVAGYAMENLGTGVFGQTYAGDGVSGNAGSGGIGVHGTAHVGSGVVGESVRGVVSDNILGDAAPVGVSGYSDSGAGVHGVSPVGNGVEGITYGDGNGVYGLHFSTSPGSGVSGVSVLGSGVDGYSFSSDPDVAAVRGQNAHGPAGLFIGNVRVTGALTKGGGGFRVDHPVDPHNKLLSHSFVESPDMMNVYSGTVTTDGQGNARIALPGYFEALNRDFRYQLTVIGQFARVMVSEEITGNEFAIQSDVPHVKVCWQVTGVRQDAWAEAHRIPVEEEKPAATKGQFVHPELFAGKAVHQHHSDRAAATVGAVLPDRIRPSAAHLLAEFSAGGAHRSPDFTDVLAEIRAWLAQRSSAGRARLWWPRRKP